MKKWWFWTIIVVVVVVLVAANFGGNNNAVPDSNTLPQSTAKVENDSKEKSKIPTEFKTALRKAKSYSDTMRMPKQGVYDQLTSEYGEKFTEEADYAISNLK